MTPRNLTVRDLPRMQVLNGTPGYINLLDARTNTLGYNTTRYARYSARLTLTILDLTRLI